MISIAGDFANAFAKKILRFYYADRRFLYYEVFQFMFSCQPHFVV